MICDHRSLDDPRSLDDLCTSTYTMSQKLCARYTLGACYLYFKRNVEKFGVRVIRSVRVIGQKIRYILSDYSYCCYSATWLLSEFSNMYQLSMTNSDSIADYWVTALSSVSWLIFLFLTPQWHFWQTLCTFVIGCATKEGLLSLVDKFLGEFYVNVISLFLNYVLHRNKMPTE